MTFYRLTQIVLYLGRDCFRDRVLLDVHHLDGKKANNSFTNLVALCKVTCHARIDPEQKE